MERLTDAQRECLRLVLEGLSVKEIALRLSRAPVTIEKRLEAARRELGVATSREAARLLAAWDDGGMGWSAGYGRSIYGPAGVPPPPLSGPDRSSPSGRTGSAHEGMTLREDRATFDFTPRFTAFRTLRAHILRSGEQGHNDLTQAERLTTMAGLAGAFAVGSALLIIAVVLLMDFLIYTSRHGS